MREYRSQPESQTHISREQRSDPPGFAGDSHRADNARQRLRVADLSRPAFHAFTSDRRIRIAGLKVSGHVSHPIALFFAYGAVLAAWFFISRVRPGLWPACARPQFARPWLEVAAAVIAAIGVIAVGQLYQHGVRLPRTGALGFLGESINQIVIFLPIILLPLLRRQPYTTAWLPLTRWPERVGWGLALALLALLVFSQTRAPVAAPWRILAALPRLDHIPHAVQVFLEDVAIAILAVRLSAALPRGEWTVPALVGVLFAAGHIPALLSTQGATLTQLGLLVPDAILGFMVVAVLLRARDVWWFACVHWTLDMMQFERVSGVGM